MYYLRSYLLVSLLLFGFAVAQSDYGTFNFVDWFREVQTARYESYLPPGPCAPQLPTTSDEFYRMRNAIVDKYTGVTPTQSFLDESIIVDCIPILQQQSLRSRPEYAQLEPPTLTSEELEEERASTQITGISGPNLDDPSIRDRLGNSMSCPTGSVPTQRLTLERLIKFETLQDFYAKGGGEFLREKRSVNSAEGSFDNDSAYSDTITEDGNSTSLRRALLSGKYLHRYAHVYKSVSCKGIYSHINLQAPQVFPGIFETFSLSQLWLVNWRSDGKIQTIESGWQTYPEKYGNNKPRLFLYWTNDGYGSTGCYNLDCGGFIQLDSTVYLGGGFKQMSFLGGLQYYISMKWYNSGGVWWLRTMGKWAGFYPSFIYSPGLQTAGALIDFGGEVTGKSIVGNIYATPPMGTGYFNPSNLFWFTAFQKRLGWYNSDLKFNSATSMTVKNDSPCYKGQVMYNQGTGWDTTFWFGGDHCIAPYL